MSEAKFAVISQNDPGFNPLGLDNYEAVGLCEGFIECEDEERIIAAWQYLIDTGLAWTLQGSFGRGAAQMIGAGLCTAHDTPELPAPQGDF